MTKHRYPALTAYILDRSALPDPNPFGFKERPASEWCAQLRTEEALARAGVFADVAAELDQAQADYAAAQPAGRDTFPYNRAMGIFLGLPLNSGGEPPCGYYMASCVTGHWKLGEAQRKAQVLIDAGRPLRIVAARSKADRKPVRCYTFRGPNQIVMDGSSATLFNGRQRVRLSSNWSTESCIVALAHALETGLPYGERA